MRIEYAMGILILSCIVIGCVYYFLQWKSDDEDCFDSDEQRYKRLNDEINKQNKRNDTHATVSDFKKSNTDDHFPDKPC